MFSLTLAISTRPSMQQQQLVTIFSANSRVSKFACGVFGLLVSATQYSTIDCKKALEAIENGGVTLNALHTKTREYEISTEVKFYFFTISFLPSNELLLMYKSISMKIFCNPASTPIVGHNF